MADGAFASLVSRTRDANSASNVLYIQVADNGGNVASITGGKLDVNATVTIETAYVDDSAFAIGTDKVNAQGYLADEVAPDSVDEGDIGLARMTLDRKQLGVIVSGDTNDARRLIIDANGAINVGTVTTLTGITNDVNIADGGNSITIDNATLAVVGGGTEATALRVTIANDSTGIVSVDDNGGSLTVDGTVAVSSVGGTVTVSATDLDIRDLTHVSDSVKIGDGTDLMGVNSDGSINVNIITATITGEVHDFNQGSGVAADATSNHDYTVTGTTFLLKSVIFSGSGNIKVEVQAGPLASLATVAVGFLTGRQGDMKQMNFDPAVEVPVTGTGTVRVIRTNRQGAATDVYSTIIGIDQ